MRRIRIAALMALLSACAAQAAEVGWFGCGPRVGVSNDPDQIIGGVQFDLGEFTRNLRFQPSAELGFGDDKISFFGNFMTAYYFPVKAAVVPYAGAQVTAWFFDNDADAPGNNDEFEDGFNAEVGLAALGGIETRLKGGTRFLVELQVKATNVPDVKLMVGWTFGKGTPPPVSR